VVDSDARPARHWLMSFQECVRAQDFVRARTMFAANVIGFGTRADIAVGLDALERDQWRQVWPRIRDFAFQVDALHCFGGDRGLCIMVPWASLGVGGDGSTFPRAGRATIMLAPPGSAWVAVHTHFSLEPDRSQGSSLP